MTATNRNNNGGKDVRRQKKFCTKCGKTLIKKEGFAEYDSYTGKPTKFWTNMQCPVYDNYYDGHYSEADEEPPFTWFVVPLFVIVMIAVLVIPR